MTQLWLLAFVLALAPGVALLWYIRRLDKYEPEPWSTIGMAFVAGCLSTVPAIFVEQWFELKLGGFLGTVWTAFIVAGFTEEALKGLFGFGAMWRRPEFNEVMDGVVYFGVAHMGFAITENLLYIFTGDSAMGAVLTGFSRTTTAVPLHVLNGMIMGYHMGAARYARTGEDRWKHVLQGFLYPMLLHGFYDLAAFNNATDIHNVTDLLRAGFGTALMYAAVVALWLVLLPRIKQAQEASPWRPRQGPTMPVAPWPCPECGVAYPMGANYCQNCAAPLAQYPAPYTPNQGGS